MFAVLQGRPRVNIPRVNILDSSRNFGERQRRSINQPRVVPEALPWVCCHDRTNPERSLCKSPVAALCERRATPISEGFRRSQTAATTSSWDFAEISERVATGSDGFQMEPFQGWNNSETITQVSRFAPNLGWPTERRWRSLFGESIPRSSMKYQIHHKRAKTMLPTTDS